MRRGRRDGNHKALSDLFRQLGCSVIDMPDTGIPGWPDCCVGSSGASGRLTHLVEYKNLETAYGRAGFNDNQTAFQREWMGEPVELVATQDDVIALVAKWRRSK